MLGRGLYVTLLCLVPAVRSLHTVMHVVESLRNLAPLLSLADLPATTLDIAAAAVPKAVVSPEAAAQSLKIAHEPEEAEALTNCPRSRRRAGERLKHAQHRCNLSRGRPRTRQ
jgi:hypothetical protein